MRPRRGRKVKSILKVKYNLHNMKANYTNKPDTIEAVGNGSTRFRYNIVEADRGYNCEEVIIYGAVTAEKVIAALIAELWGNGIEQKLINDYNEFKAGLSDNADAETKYLDFLRKRKVLKEFVHGVI